MGTWFNTDESMTRAGKWLSAGTGLGGLAMFLACLTLNGVEGEQLFWRHLLGILAAPGTWLKEVLLGLLFFGFMLIAVLAGAIAGSRYLCKRIGDTLIAYPRPVLFLGGFILGSLIVAAGVFYIIYTLITELF
jgi:hypothetical protein